MLQQTQVERVVPYYEEFLRRFATVSSLARASLEEVLAAWSGLGYYRRARALHAAARQIVVRGGFPRKMAGWLELPGVGPYTAAAIASIAFGERVAAIDGNVTRVLSRYAGRRERLGSGELREKLQLLAQSMVDRERPGDSNQALIELGATVCRPRDPRCGFCPLARSCAALLEGDPERYPVGGKRRALERLRWLAVVVQDDERVLLVRRSESTPLLAGLWEVPWVEWAAPEEAERALSKRYGGRWRLGSRRGRVRHAITHRDIRLDVWSGTLGAPDQVAENGSAGWYSESEVDALATTSLVKKVLLCAAAA